MLKSPVWEQNSYCTQLCNDTAVDVLYLGEAVLLTPKQGVFESL